MTYSVRDRRLSELGSGLTCDVSKDVWPFVIDAPFPPFELGQVVVLVRDEKLAEKIVVLLNEEVQSG